MRKNQGDGRRAERRRRQREELFAGAKRVSTEELEAFEEENSGLDGTWLGPTPEPTPVAKLPGDAGAFAWALSDQLQFLLYRRS